LAINDFSLAAERKFWIVAFSVAALRYVTGDFIHDIASTTDRSVSIVIAFSATLS
jgi:hypothetical protein